MIKKDYKFLVVLYLIMIAITYLLVLKVDKVYEKNYNSFYENKISMNE